ncbi:hypothetical protein LINGRAHAP2_LOCUS14486, partial [Linum grandiflorum]
MLAKPFGHLVEDLDCSATATSKKKNKYLKPLPYVFFSDPSVVKDQGQSSATAAPPSSVAPKQQSTMPQCDPETLVQEDPLINELEDMLLNDRKRARYEDDSMDDIPPKRL